MFNYFGRQKFIEYLSSLSGEELMNKIDDIEKILDSTKFDSKELENDLSEALDHMKAHVINRYRAVAIREAVEMM